jgi:hypothetical protein
MPAGYFAPARNYFDGRIVTREGLRKTLEPFYSAAMAEDQGRQIRLHAMVEGGTRIFDAALDPVGNIAGWGSDIVGTGARCGGGSQMLATRPGDGAGPDAIQAFSIVNRVPVALTAPVDFPGPVTALWPVDDSAALAVSWNPGTGKYQAYVVTVVCGS